MLSVNILLINVSAGALLFPWQLSAAKKRGWGQDGFRWSADGHQRHPMNIFTTSGS